MLKTFTHAVIIALVAYVFLRFAPPLPISSLVTQKESLFTVSGQGKVTVVPDTAIVSLGVNLTGPTVKSVQSQANQTINSLISQLKSQGLDEADIETSNYSIYPQYDFQSGRNRITGYTISAQLSLTVRQLDNLTAVIDSATELGANTVSSIQFTIDEDRRRELLNEAREKAVADAQSKANSLSKAAGLTLGRLVNVQESGASYPRPLLYESKALDLATAGGDTSTSLEPGSTDITSSVTLSYETR